MPSLVTRFGSRRNSLSVLLLLILVALILVDALFVEEKILDTTTYFYLFFSTLAILYLVYPLWANRKFTRYYWERTKRNRLSVLGLIYIIFLIAVALIGPQFTLEPTAVKFEEMNLPPVGLTFQQSVYDLDTGTFTTKETPGTWKHPLGTDDKGRDMLAMLVSGARVSLQVGLLATGIAIILGTIIGVLSAYLGGWADNALMRFTDVVMTFPFFLLLVLVVFIFGPDLAFIILIIVK